MKSLSKILICNALAISTVVVLADDWLRSMPEFELTDHLGYDRHSVEGRDGGNSSNGVTSKRVKTGSREIDLEGPATGTALRAAVGAQSASNGYQTSTTR